MQLLPVECTLLNPKRRHPLARDGQQHAMGDWYALLVVCKGIEPTMGQGYHDPNLPVKNLKKALGEMIQQAGPSVHLPSGCSLGWHSIFLKFQLQFPQL